MKIGKLKSRLHTRKLRRNKQIRKFKKTGKRGHARAAKREARAVRKLRHLLKVAIREARHRPKKGLDWAWGEISGEAMIRAGYRFACRYLSHEESKNLTRAEAERLAKAGVFLVVVWESTGTRAKDGFKAGVEDAHEAIHQAERCGKPNDRPIFFAVDFEAQGPEIHSYFEGVKSVLGKDRAGAYAGVDAMRYLFNQGLIGYGWQTYAWSRGEWDERAHLRQVSNEHTFEGVGVDYDRSIKPDYGQWMPE